MGGEFFKLPFSEGSGSGVGAILWVFNIIYYPFGRVWIYMLLSISLLFFSRFPIFLFVYYWWCFDSLFCVPLLIQGNLATLEQYLNIAAIDLNSASNSAPSAAKTASNSALSLLLFLDSLIKHPYNLDQVFLWKFI